MITNRIKDLFPQHVRQWVKSHPNLATVVDVMMNMRRRDLPVFDVLAMLTANEREFLFQLAKGNNPEKEIVEIGCYSGGSAFYLGRGAQISGSHVYSIDPFDSELDRQWQEWDGTVYYKHHKKPSRQEVEKDIRKYGLQSTVTLIEGFSTELARRWDKTIGLLFIDGNHKQVREDYDAWKNYLAGNAVAAFHDANFPLHIHGRSDVTESVQRIQKDYGLTLRGSTDRIMCLG